MKCILVLCLLSLVALSVAAPQDEEECPEGTSRYRVVGCGRVTPEATCFNPKPIKEDYLACNFSACYCDEYTVRNTETKQCVPLGECLE